MPRIAARRNWWPGPHAQVDWSHPSANGLKGYGCGYEEWTDIAQPYFPTPGGSLMPPSGSTRVSTPWGKGISSQPYETRCVDYVIRGTNPDGRSMMVWIGLDSSSAKGMALGLAGLNGSAFGGIGVGSGSIATTGNNLVGKDLTNDRDTGVAIGLGFHSIAMTATDAATSDYFIDGSFAANMTAATISNVTPYYVELCGYEPGFWNTLQPGIVGPWAVWERLLAPTEIARLHTDPLQMLRR